MKEIYYFQCDYCDATFQDEYECLKHEWENHRYPKIANELVLLHNGSPLPFSYDLSINDIDCINVSSQEAAIFINAWFDEVGYNQPIKLPKGAEEYPLGTYYWEDPHIDGIYVNTMDKIIQIFNTIGVKDIESLIADIEAKINDVSVKNVSDRKKIPIDGNEMAYLNYVTESM